MPKTEQTKGIERVLTYRTKKREVGLEGKVLKVEGGLSTGLPMCLVALRMDTKGILI